jgi:hypothetical protein
MVLLICRPQSRDEKETFGLKNDGEKEFLRHVNATFAFGLNSTYIFSSHTLFYFYHTAGAVSEVTVSAVDVSVCNSSI